MVIALGVTYVGCYVNIAVRSWTRLDCTNQWMDYCGLLKHLPAGVF